MRHNNNIIYLILLSALNIAGCAIQNSVAPKKASGTEVVGCYSSVHVLGYDIRTLHLLSSGTFKAETFGEFSRTSLVEGTKWLRRITLMRMTTNEIFLLAK